ncbi:protein disulfide-isomerase [Pustulibacterium marinum]|uniref:Protein disulfide-isomerase n=1 Tax=Pustulibacterium marinum TaxID=1224947 RepID=A0A1I7EV39_9FLAO|nr:thioredoxin family protein [Pustulibacterium marinum]SFU27763.1 protein disulfide-isomerase [Pustulibacterium marinum]
MKNYIVIALLFLSTLVTNAQEKLTWHTNFEEASKIAMKEGKPLMLFFTGSDWCGWCVRLQKEVFEHDEFVDWAEENVVLLELDFPRRKELPYELKQQNFNLQQLLGVRGYPTVWFANVENQGTKKAPKLNLDKLGRMGYQRGGSEAWIASAEALINKK